MYNECRHVMPSGRKCHSPALRNLPYCYYHQNLHRYGNPSSPEKAILFSIEDVRGIQIALTQVLASLNSPYMDTRRAGLQIGAQLAKHATALEPHEAVRTCEETAGATLAPEKTVCEPPRDCRTCPRQDTCENFEESEEEEQSEEEEENNEEFEDDYLADETEREDECDKQSDSEDDGNSERKPVEKEAALIKRAMRLLAT